MKRQIPVGYKCYPLIKGAGAGWYAPGGHPGWGEDPLENALIMTEHGPQWFDKRNPLHRQLTGYNEQKIVLLEIDESCPSQTTVIRTVLRLIPGEGCPNG